MINQTFKIYEKYKFCSLLLPLLISSTFFCAVFLSFCAFFVLVCSPVLILDLARSKAFLALIYKELYLCTIVQVRRRIFCKDDVLTSDIETSFLRLSISRYGLAHELDLLIRNNKPKPVLACEELHRTCVYGFLVKFSVIRLARNFLSTWKFYFLCLGTLGVRFVDYKLNFHPFFE